MAGSPSRYAIPGSTADVPCLWVLGYLGPGWFLNSCSAVHAAELLSWRIVNGRKYKLVWVDVVFRKGRCGH
jgi:hypothetical protein